jgi:hypothetical protein
MSAILNDQCVHYLRDALGSGAAGLDVVPKLLLRVLKEDMWRDRFEQQLKVNVHFDSFEAFCRTQPLEGLGCDVALIKRIVADDARALDMLDKALGSHQGERADIVDNVNEVRPVGNSAAQALRRLRRDRPDLHGRVLDGELSPHAAAVEAGFRRRTFTCPADVAGATKALLRHFSADEIKTIKASL